MLLLTCINAVRQWYEGGGAGLYDAVACHVMVMWGSGMKVVVLA